MAAIRLFDAGRENTAGLREYLEGVYLPWVELERGRPADWKTAECYESTATWWESIVGNVPVERITQHHIDGFMRGLRASVSCRTRRRLAAMTVRKHAANLRAVLRQATAAGVLPPGTVGVKLPRRERQLPFGHISRADVGQMIAAARGMRAPRPLETGVTAGEWWRGLLGWLYFTGSRIEETLLLEWAWLNGDEALIPGAVGGRRIRKHAVPHVVYLHPELLEWLEPLRDARQGPWVFAYRDCAKPHPPAMRGAIRGLTRLHERLRGLAGVRKIAGSGWHAYRKTHLTELAAINPLAAQLSSSHGGGNLMCEFYLDVPRLMRAAIAQLPVPEGK